MFGRQPVVDRQHRHVERARHLGAERLVRVEIAEHEAAAVQEQQERPGLARLARVVEPEADLARRPRAGQVADHRQFAHRRVGDLARGEHHVARLGRPRFVRFRPGQAVQIIEELADVGADIGFGHMKLLGMRIENAYLMVS